MRGEVSVSSRERERERERERDRERRKVCRGRGRYYICVFASGGQHTVFFKRLPDPAYC